MKKISFIIFLLITSGTSFAQMRGQQQGMGQGQASMPEFKAKNFAGILKYNDTKVFKKLGIKDSAMKQNIDKHLIEYNKKIDEILFLNTPKLEKIEREVNTQREYAMISKDKQAMMSVMEEARKQLAPIKKEVIDANKILNQELSRILDEKQYKKWIKYQKAKKKSLKPKTPMNANNPSARKGKGGMSGGGGRGRKMGY